MRAIWTGSLSFGLVNIPVALFSGVDPREELELHMLHKKDLQPIRYARICRGEDKEIPYDEIVKGYEIADGDFVVLSDEDFHKANLKKTKTIAIESFVGEKEIDVRYYEKPYYLAPQKGADHAYALLRDALEKSGRVAVGRFVMRNRENLGVIKPVGKVITFTQIRFPSELRSTQELELPARLEAGGREMEMALSLIEQLSGPFKPEEFHDTYTEELKEIIAEKLQGHTPTPHGNAPQPTRVHDLMAALQASLEQASKQRAPEPEAPKPKRTAKFAGTESKKPEQKIDHGTHRVRQKTHVR